VAARFARCHLVINRSQLNFGVRRRSKHRSRLDEHILIAADWSQAPM